ncbi:MAG: cytochrome c family protein [Hyphomicrobiales bacterium]|nr:MAG: cytochrome c family protein [Hyphomicrobiales bacterium]
MNSTQLTKIAAAVVMSLLALIVIGKFTSFLYAPHTPEKPGFEVAIEEAEHSGAAEEAAPVVNLAALMLTADVAKGETVAKKCASCHTFENGGKNGAGPNLFDILNREIASTDGFKYSGAFGDKKAEGLAWGYEELFEFIKKPKAFIKGTAMGFGGIKRDSQRADLIAYLRSLSASPADLPALAAIEAETAPAAEAE